MVFRNTLLQFACTESFFRNNQHGLSDARFIVDHFSTRLENRGTYGSSNISLYPHYTQITPAYPIHRENGTKDIIDHIVVKRTPSHSQIFVWPGHNGYAGVLFWSSISITRRRHMILQHHTIVNRSESSVVTPPVI